ncbi:hypothetical protein [Methylocapsa acidiphila]|uniref:hypothetical protein n=1 Tax=Methylocapsa acidiphila TaxID=133552 RepID=UPI0004255291|nr:hypothetical protein [Methylocapsa acidiphila]
MATIPVKLLDRLRDSISGLRLADAEIAALRPSIEAGLDAPFLVSARKLKGLKHEGVEITIKLHLFDLEEDGRAS